MYHGHIVLDVWEIGELSLCQDKVFLLPLRSEAALAFLVEGSFFDWYGAA